MSPIAIIVQDFTQSRRAAESFSSIELSVGIVVDGQARIARHSKYCRGSNPLLRGSAPLRAISFEGER